MNPTRPDIYGGRHQVDLSVPLSQQNAHQRIATPVVSRVNAEARAILQHNDNIPLSQRNAHQHSDQIFSRPDVLIVRSEESLQPIYVRIEHQQPNISNGINQFHQHVPLSQMNAHQNFGNITARPDVARAGVSQQPIYTPVLHQHHNPQINAYVPQMQNQPPVLQPQVYVPTPQTTLSRGNTHIRSPSQL